MLLSIFRKEEGTPPCHSEPTSQFDTRPSDKKKLNVNYFMAGKKSTAVGIMH